jgi:hypothetical protein
MKAFRWIIIPYSFVTGSLFAQTGKVGLNTASPQAMFHVADSSVLFSATALHNGNPPLSGAGIRMMWYPAKAAYRAGRVTSTQWNKDSIGDYSVAMGSNCKAKGSGSVALGLGNTASGSGSVAFGSNTKATGTFAVALGGGSTASGNHSIAMGTSSKSTGDYSVALGNDVETGSHSIAAGYKTLATGANSTAFGFVTRALSFGTFACGVWSTAQGIYSASIGHHNIANGYASTVIGMFNDSLVSIQNTVSATTPLFIIGNGENDTTRSNALVVRKDGRLGLGTDNPSRLLEVSGSGNQAARITSTNGDDAALELFRQGSGADFKLVDSVGVLYVSRSTDDFASSIEAVRITHNMLAPGIDNAVDLGTSAYRWREVWAVDGTINTSDIRDKESIRNLTDALPSVMRLRPVTFNWNYESEDHKSPRIGFIAQELLEVLPGVVVTHAWKEESETSPAVWAKVERLGVRYSEIIPVLTKAIQEQQTLIESQQALIQDLQGRMLALEAKR